MATATVIVREVSPVSLELVLFGRKDEQLVPMSVSRDLM